MKAGELSKGDRFRVVGWNPNKILEVFYPYFKESSSDFLNLQICSLDPDHRKILPEKARVILAAECFYDKHDGLYKYPYIIPIDTEVEIVSKG